MTEPTQPPRDPERATVLKLFDGGKPPSATPEALRTVELEITNGVMAARYGVTAKASFLKFEALKRAGFTESQALYLIGVSPW